MVHSRTGRQAVRRRRTVVASMAAVAVLMSSLTATAAFADNGITPPPDLTLTGDMAFGSTVSVTGGAWMPETTTVGVAWFADDTPIVEPAGKGDDLELSVTADLIGKTISADVTGTDNGVSSTPEHLVAPGPVTGPVATLAAAPVVGTPVEAVEGVWPAGTTFTYQWFADGTPIADATSTAYTPQIDDHGKGLAVAVTGTAAGFDPLTVTSDAAKVAGQSFTTAPKPTISGNPKVDSTLTAVPGDWTPVATSLSYVWSVGGTTVGKGATFTPDGSRVGQQVTVTVTASAPGYEAAPQTSDPVTIAQGSYTTTSAPSISGTVRVGNKLTAKTGTWSPTATFAYAWKVSGAQVSTATTFTPAASQLGQGLTLTVTATRLGYPTMSKTTASVKIGYGVFSAPTPKISGSAIVGKTLTVSTGTWTPSATKSYRWLRNGVAISGATGTSYKVTSTDYGKKLSVRVTGKRTAYTTKTVTSASTSTVVKPFSRTTAPTITGTTRVGSTLTAHITTWSPTTSSHSWQWKRNGVAISGATGSTHKLTTSDYGKKITVTYTGKRGGYATTARTSASTVTILGPAAVIKSDGAYRVGTQVKPGTYYANAPIDCQWGRFDSGQNLIDSMYAEAAGRQIVTIKSTDYYFVTIGCGSWTPLLKLTTPATTVGNGTQKIGTTMQSGHYVTKAAVTDSCAAAVLTGFGGAEDVDPSDRIFYVSGSSGPIEVYLTPDDVGFVSYNCGTWTRVGP